jgi:large repetitive protein
LVYHALAFFGRDGESWLRGFMEEPMIFRRRRAVSRLAHAVARIEPLERRVFLSSAPMFVSGSLAPITVDLGQSFSDLISTAGSSTARITESGALPGGVKFTEFSDGTASISGIPNGIGKAYTIDLKATNTAGTATGTIVLDVDQKPKITSRNAFDFNTDFGGTFTVTTSNVFPTPTLTLAAQNVLTGVTFVDNGNGTGTLTVPPDSVAPGYYAASNGNALTVLASNNAGTVSQNFMLTIDEAPIFETASSETVTLGVPSDFEIVANGYPNVRMGESGHLPQGMTFHYITNNSTTYNGTATLSGTPTQAGVYDITISAHNLVGVGGPPVNQSFILTVDEPPAIKGTATNYGFSFGQPVNETIALTGFPTPISISNILNLPAGLSLTTNTAGTALLLTGTPAATGMATVDFLLSNADFNGVNAVAASITINVT